MGCFSMSNDTDLVDELFSMAKDPDDFTRAELGEMILIAATEIIKLREFGPLTNSFAVALGRDRSSVSQRAGQFPNRTKYRAKRPAR
jgi:hypothetical protein